MNADAELALQIITKERTEWTNKHQNFTQPIQGVYDVWNPDIADGQEMQGLRAAVSGLQGLVQKAAAANVRLHPLGSGWSFSRVAVADGWLLNTKPLNWIFQMSQGSVSEDYPGAADDLLFTQCGASVRQLNEYLQQRGRSLKTAGASNGQTIAGAFSTGTHGSAVRVGAMQDFVVGLHLIVGEDRHLWLERASYPVVSERFIERLGAELVRDDTLFNAALVSFGGFGIIHAAMIETEPIYLLEAHRQRVPFGETLKHTIDTLDFSEAPVPYSGEEPYHFQVVINPYDIADGVYVETMYRRPYSDTYTRPEKGPGGLGPGDDLLHVIGTLSDEIPEMIPGIMGGFFESLYGEYSGRTGTLGDMFGSTSIRGAATGAGIGVPLERAGEVLQTVQSVNDSEGPFAGVWALRYVKASEALLAFTRFDTTCVLDLDGVESRRSRAFFRAVRTALEQRQIPHTVHWGKANDVDGKDVRQMYGSSAVDAWIGARETLLDSQTREMFASPFLERTGLHKG